MRNQFQPIKKLARVALDQADNCKAVVDVVLSIEKEFKITGEQVLLDQANELRGMVTRHLRRKEPAPKKDKDTPTPETKQKLRKDPVMIMFNRNSLSVQDLRSVDLIRNCIEAISKGISLKGSNLDSVRVDGHGAFRDPIDRMTLKMNYDYSTVYAPWADEMKTYVVPETRELKRACPMLTEGERIQIELSGGTMDAPLQCKADWTPTVRNMKKHERIRLRHIDLVKQVVVDGVRIREVEGNYKVRNGSLSKPFISTIRRFTALCERAGI